MKNVCCAPCTLVHEKNQTQTDEFSTNKEHFKIASAQLKGNIWLDGLFGIEKENIRVDHEGLLSQKPHPEVFGNKLKHPYITTDFSESQIEMRTPPLPDIKKTVGFLETIHDIVSLELEDEYLWPQSIPPILPDDAKIPIAKYDDEGIEAQQYREFLAQKYGPKNQMLSGIHFNFSFSEKLLESLYSLSNSNISYKDFKDAAYLKVTRQMLRMRWMYVLLFGNSPVVDSTFELKCKHNPNRINKNVIGLSIRNSCYGYHNLGVIYPDYSSVQNFKLSVDKLIKDGVIKSSKELYTQVRPKFTHESNHISYVEFRFIDIDPLTKAGITENALYFLHSLALYGLLSEEPDSFDAKSQEIANNYLGYVALNGLQLNPFVDEKTGKVINVWQEMKNQLQAISDIFTLYSIENPEYLKALEDVKMLADHPDSRKVNGVLDGIVKRGYIPFHLDLAQKFLKESQEKNYHFIGLEDMELSTQLLLREAVKRGVSFEILDQKENFIRLNQNDNQQYVKQATKTSLDQYSSILTMENKLITKKILDETGIKTPKGLEYSNGETAKSDFHFFKNKAIVIKPNQTNFGIGITIIKNNSDLSVFERAIDIAFENDSTVLIEEFIEGKEFRFFVLNQEVVGILHRVPANVTGNGTSSIRELVDVKNQDPLRGKGYRTPLEKIQLGEAESIFLKAQQKDFDYIPKQDETVFLRENSNISTGGDSIDYTDDIPDSYKQIAIQAANALQVKITGLDMMIKDITAQPTPENYTIIELNFNPAIHIHCHPYKGKNRKIYEKLLTALGY
ncbi:MAG: glutamate/cysteine ligase,/amino acid ligase [Bacteroidetes bacterium]|nr:glutamate/cysteine ligase,/amino acid ligase [Bacteroidota bacterium]